MTSFAYRNQILFHSSRRIVLIESRHGQFWMIADVADMVYSAEQSFPALLVYVVPSDDATLPALCAFIMMSLQDLRLQRDPFLGLVEPPQLISLHPFSDIAFRNHKKMAGPSARLP